MNWENEVAKIRRMGNEELLSRLVGLARENGAMRFAARRDNDLERLINEMRIEAYRRMQHPAVSSGPFS